MSARARLFCPTPPLELCIVLGPGGAPLWLRSLAEGLTEDGHSLSFVELEARTSSPSVLWDGYRRILRRSLGFRLYARLAGILAAAGTDQFEKLRPAPGDPSKPFDLCLDFTFAGSGPEVLPASRLGTIRLGVEEEAEGWPFLAEMARGGEAVRCLAEHLGPSGKARILAEAWVGLHPYSLQASLDRFVSRLGDLARKAIRQVGTDDDSRALAKPGGPVLQRPPSGSLPRLFGKCLREFRRRVSKRLLRREQWIMAVDLAREGTWFDLARGSRLLPPRDRIWADPFPFLRDGRTWLFFEEQLYGQNGHLSCFELFEDGSHGEAVTILERPYHLSYPYVFEDSGELYMVPESSENGNIDLYRCLDFPNSWTLVMPLIEGIEAADTSLLHREDGWWLFTAASPVRGNSLNDQLYLFHSPVLLSGEWRPHPLNPVVADVRSARGAGRIFERDGRLYRPSQDCASSYGYCVCLNEIVELSDTRYRETPRVTLSPEATEDLVALHTFNTIGKISVIDGKIMRGRMLDLRAKGRR